ncbi:hypothetical protein [Nocardia sp. NPDC047038]|uniref:hypothetical protein n=1 Tax=Nocardia sp. NPDC047038 TaxID=3154338 RepID=UPI0033C38157
MIAWEGTCPEGTTLPGGASLQIVTRGGDITVGDATVEFHGDRFSTGLMIYDYARRRLERGKTYHLELRVPPPSFKVFADGTLTL